MRLIDADAAVERLQRRSDMFRFDKRYEAVMRDAIGEVLTAPTLDAVPVVRCADCKHRCTFVCPMYHTETCLDDLDGFDDYDVDRTDDDGFCHLGERWEGEEDD